MTFTVAKYLKQRLEEARVERIFGVAGNYSAAFLNTIDEDPETTLRISGNTNEINAGHCADGFARASGKPAAVCVTYGVGAFSVLNPVAGSYVEHNRVIVINGAPEFSEQQRQRVEGLLYSHMTGDPNSNIDAFRKVTVAAEQIVDAAQAPAKIDAVINACINQGRPGYLDVFEDVWRQTCAKPESSLAPEKHPGCPSNTQGAVDATLKMIEQLGNPLFWAGIEIQRQNLQDEFAAMVENTQTPYVTSILAKSVLGENNPQFLGVYNGNATPEKIITQFESAGCRVGLGVWNTSKNLGGTSIWSNTSVMANNQGVKVGRRYFPNVVLGDFIAGLSAGLVNYRCKTTLNNAGASLIESYQQDEGPLTYDSFFAAINNYLRKEHVVVVDAGFSLLGAQNLHIAERNGFVSQAAWLSIGYSVPASLGVKFAAPTKRPLVFIGDGAFQETCQEVSGHNFYGFNNVVFVLDNGIYGIEQMLVNPNPFRSKDDPNKKARFRDYKNPILNTVYRYNDLHPWQYEKIVDMVGGKGFFVSNHEELESCLSKIDDLPDTNIVVRVQLPKTNIPASIAYHLAGTGEDETESPDWPPYCPPLKVLTS